MPSVTPTERDKPSGRREKLDVRSTPSIVDKLLGGQKPGQANSRPQISKVPESAVLAQLRTFLPQMQSANQQLSQRTDIEPAVTISDMQEEPAASMLEEQEDDETGEHVQMDIACGVVDLKDEAAVRAAEGMIDGAQPAERGEDSSTSDNDGESESDNDADDAATNAHATDVAEVHGTSSPHTDTGMIDKRLSATSNQTSSASKDHARQRKPNILEL